MIIDSAVHANSLGAQWEQNTQIRFSCAKLEANLNVQIEVL